MRVGAPGEISVAILNVLSVFITAVLFPVRLPNLTSPLKRLSMNYGRPRGITLICLKSVSGAFTVSSILVNLPIVSP